MLGIRRNPLKAQKAARHASLDMTYLYTVPDHERETAQQQRMFDALKKRRSGKRLMDLEGDWDHSVRLPGGLDKWARAKLRTTGSVRHNAPVSLYISSVSATQWTM